MFSNKGDPMGGWDWSTLDPPLGERKIHLCLLSGGHADTDNFAPMGISACSMASRIPWQEGSDEHRDTLPLTLDCSVLHDLCVQPAHMQASLATLSRKDRALAIVSPRRGGPTSAPPTEDGDSESQAPSLCGLGNVFMHHNPTDILPWWTPCAPHHLHPVLHS